MPRPMNPFEFAARMRRGAAAMIYMRQEGLGDQIELSGGDLANLIAFTHDRAEQKKFSADDIPPRIRKLMQHLEQGAEHGQEDGVQ